MNALTEISIDVLDNVSGGVAPSYRRYVTGGTAEPVLRNGWSADLLKGGKILVTSPRGVEHQMSIAPARTPRF